MWSCAATSVGGRGSAFCVEVLKVDPGRGEGGSEDAIVSGRDMVAVDTGLRAGTLSDAGTGRLRFRIEAAAFAGTCDMGCWWISGVCVGSGGGGDGGGECW
jgi:hypothetical protein